MTKRRAPMSFEAALTTIAGLLGWPEVAKICRREERTVRNWSDPDTSACVTLEAALALDAAYMAAGGDFAPLQLAYAARLDAAAAAACPTSAAIVVAAGAAAKESGEAIAATLNASRPDASDGDLAIAERELEESIVAQSAALAAVKGRRGKGSSGEG